MSAFNPVTIAFIVVMLLVYFLSPKQFRRSNTLPTILTTLGILGTFIGITIGLLKFDVTNVEASVPNLLDGLRIAFLTSIFGITAAILIRLKNIFRQRNEDATSTEQDFGTSLISALERIHQEQINTRDTIVKGLATLKDSFVGDGDTTIVTQLQKIRTSISDKSDDHLAASKRTEDQLDSISESLVSISKTTGESLAAEERLEDSLQTLHQAAATISTTIETNFNTLNSRLAEFAEELAENNTKTFIEALEGAIRDFNNQLTEQFGENFKHLNSAVGRLVDWQEQYRQQLTELSGRFDEAAGTLRDTGTDLKNIAQDIGAAVELLDELDTFVESTKAHVAQLQASLQAHDELASRAKEAFPIIQEGIEELTSGFTSHVENMNEATRQQAEEIRSTVQEQATIMTESIKAFSGQASQSFQALESQVDAHMTRSSEVIAAQLKRLDEDLERELGKAISSLGSQLLSLSTKFVEDYTPLTERLRDVVRIAEGDGHVR